jgi:hypothetical protein
MTNTRTHASCLFLLLAAAGGCGTNDEAVVGTPVSGDVSAADIERASFMDEVSALKRRMGAGAATSRELYELVGRFDGKALGSAPPPPALQAQPLHRPAVADDVELKTGALTDVSIRVRDEVVPFKRTSIGKVVVNPGETLTVYADASGTVDPFLIAYWENSFIHTVGVNDDVAPGNLNSKITWTLPANSAAREVTVIGFAYSDYTQGTGTIRYYVGNRTYVAPLAPFSGAVRYSANLWPTPPCSNWVGTTYSAGPIPENRKTLRVLAQMTGEETDVYYWPMGGVWGNSPFSMGNIPDGYPSLDLIFAYDPVPAGKTIRIIKDRRYSCP